MVNVMKKILFCLLFVVLIIPSCADKKALLIGQYNESPVIKIQYWGNNWQSLPLSQRISPATPELIERIRMENELNGYTEKTVSATPPPAYLEALESIESRLPEPVRKLAAERIIGIYAVDALGTSGYAEAVKDETGNEKYVIIVLDEKALLARTANEWATWKENSAFKPIPGNNNRMQAIIELDQADTVVNAIRYVLLHEIGHALGLASHVHPSWDIGKPAPVELPFPRLSWTLDDKGRIVSLFDKQFPERASISYYSFEKARLSSDQIVPVYQKLYDHTNFPTLYAATNQWEDFAESFVTYFHVILENRPWHIIIKNQGKPDNIFKTCWGETRCAAKQAFMEKWFADPQEIK